MRPERSLSRRIITVAAISAGLIMLIAAIAAGLLLQTHIERGFDARLRQEAQELLGGLSRAEDGTLIIATVPDSSAYEQRFSGWYWLIRDKDEVAARSRSLITHELPRVEASATLLATGPRGEALRTVTVQGRADGAQTSFIVTVAGPQSEIDRVLAAELVAVVAGMAVLGLALIGVLWWQINQSLSPLKDLARDIEQLRDGHIPALPASGYVELSRLTATINELLGQSRGLVAGYRERAAKLAHALKTPLALIAARAGAHGAIPDEKVLDALAAMQRQIDHNLKRARAASGSSAFATRVPVAEVVADLMFAFGHASRPHSPKQSVSIPRGAVFIGEREDLEEMLGNLLENAHRWARSSVSVSSRILDDHLEIVVEDDGPGFPSTVISSELNRPDRRQPIEVAEPSDQGLGLVITREIAAAYSGTLKVGNSGSGGAQVVLRFPRGATTR